MRTVRTLHSTLQLAADLIVSVYLVASLLFTHISFAVCVEVGTFTAVSMLANKVGIAEAYISSVMVAMGNWSIHFSVKLIPILRLGSIYAEVDTSTVVSMLEA